MTSSNYDFRQIANIAFIYYVKVTKRDKILLPAVEKQLGKKWNYIIVCDDPVYNGVYRGDPSLELRIWNNKGKPCFVVPLKKTEKIKDLDEIDPSLPLGKYILNIIKNIRNSREHSEE